MATLAFAGAAIVKIISEGISAAGKHYQQMQRKEYEGESNRFHRPPPIYPTVPPESDPAGKKGKKNRTTNDKEETDLTVFPCSNPLQGGRLRKNAAGGYLQFQLFVLFLNNKPGICPVKVHFRNFIT